MPKGVPWSRPEVDELLRLREEGNTVSEIAARMGRSEQAVMKKLTRLGLKVVHLQETNQTTTTELIMPEELPSFEEALKILVATMRDLMKPGITKAEILRAKSLVQAVKVYQEKLANYIDYRKIEIELLRMRAELEKRLESAGVEPRIARRILPRPVDVATKRLSLSREELPQSSKVRSCDRHPRDSEKVSRKEIVKLHG